MRPSRLLLMPFALLALAACHDNGVSVNARPPLGGVRFINAVPDGGPVDIKMIDQVQWSASSVNSNGYGLAFRSGTAYWPTEAKARHIRVFPTDSSLAVTTTVLLDTTITVEANKNVTLMLVGSRAAGGKIRFIQIDDNPTVPANQVGIRFVNTAATAATGYVITDTTAALPAPAFPAVAPLTASSYLYRNTGKFFMQATVGASTTNFTIAPTGAPADGLVGVTAGYNGPGSALGAYLFPASVAGTAAPQSTAFKSPAIIYFVDLIPTPPTG